MARLTKQHSDFRHPGLSYLNFKLLEMDRVLTAFLGRLQHRGLPSRLARHADIGVDGFVDEILDCESRREGFQGFQDTPEITRRWVETHLVDMVNRGKPTQAVAGLRPLHGFTYKFRNSKHSRPAGADEHLYEMLSGAPGERGDAALRQLKAFFFEGVDPATDSPRPAHPIDVETQALLHLCTSAEKKVDDRPDMSKPRRSYPPFCPSQAELLADDVLRLLYHQEHIPRSVMVEYFKILFAFHLALYHLRLIKALPKALARGHVRHRCQLPSVPAAPEESGPDCEYGIGLFLDVAAVSGTPAARLASRSAAVWQQRFPSYIRSAYEVKKLDEFAEHLVLKRKLPKPTGGVFSVDDVLTMGHRTDLRRERDQFFGYRLASLLESTEADGEPPAEITQILELGLDDYSAYLEILSAYKGDFHRRYLNQCLDSLLLKNRAGALIAQPQGSQRRFILDSRLIEVLLQIALLQPSDNWAFHTEPLRVDQFLTILRLRYGLYVDRLPDGDGFSQPSIDDHAALRDNVRAFTDRLREIGFYSDLSDAYLTQTISPRYAISEQAQ
ncbi:MAG: methylation-associated defense system protein MAD7 [Pseudonocardiaceae bacterium]